MLDRHLPHRRRGDQQHVRGVGDRGARGGRELAGRRDRPDVGVGVQQQCGHDQAARSSPCNGSKRSAGMAIGKKPSSRVGGGTTGTSRTKGVPARATTTSSPASAASNNREKCALASATLYILVMLIRLT